MGLMHNFKLLALIAACPARMVVNCCRAFLASPSAPVGGLETSTQHSAAQNHNHWDQICAAEKERVSVWVFILQM